MWSISASETLGRVMMIIGGKREAGGETTGTAGRSKKNDP